MNIDLEIIYGTSTSTVLSICCRVTYTIVIIVHMSAVTVINLCPLQLSTGVNFIKVLHL